MSSFSRIEVAGGGDLSGVPDEARGFVGCSSRTSKQTSAIYLFFSLRLWRFLISRIGVTMLVLQKYRKRAIYFEIK